MSRLIIVFQTSYLSFNDVQKLMSLIHVLLDFQRVAYQFVFSERVLYTTQRIHPTDYIIMFNSGKTQCNYL